MSHSIKKKKKPLIYEGINHYRIFSKKIKKIKNYIISIQSLEPVTYFKVSVLIVLEVALEVEFLLGCDGVPGIYCGGEYFITK